MFDCVQFLQPNKMQYNLLDLNSEHVQHTPFTLNNKDGHTLQCSLFKTQRYSRTCVLYLHSYNTCRVEAVEYLPHFVNAEFDLCTFDFQAAGKSQGTFVTFGMKEKHDLVAVIEYLNLRYQSIILWGRSMGATTALLYMLNFKYQNIKALVLDSPFNNLNDVIINMIQQKIALPRLLIQGLCEVLKSQVQKKYNFNLDGIRLPNKIQIDCPMIILGQKDDKIVPFKQCEEIYNSYQGPKKMLLIQNQHNEKREGSIIEQILKYLISISPQTRLSPTKQPKAFVGDEEDYRMAHGVMIKNKIMNRNRSAHINRSLNSAQQQKLKGIMQLY